MFGYQCLTCGRLDGKWVKRADIENPQQLPDWDKGLEERVVTMWAQEEQTVRASEAYSRSTQWWQAYRAFLNSPQWAEMRRRVMVRSGRVCEACLTAKATQVHHTSYPKRPPEIGSLSWTPPTVDDFANQPLYELRAICTECHGFLHSHLRQEAA